MNTIVRFSAFVGRTFAGWALLFAFLGFFLPDFFRQFVPWVSVLLGIVMFGMGLTLTLDDFREVGKRPKDVLQGVAMQFLLMPGLALLLCWIIPMPDAVKVGVILVGCCPGGTSSNVMTFLSKGDIALSVTCTAVTTLMAPLVTPFLVWALAHNYLPVDAVAMFLDIVKVVLVPLAAGVIIQKLFPNVVSTSKGILPLVSAIGIVLIVAAVVGNSRAKIAETGALIFAVVVLHNGLGYLLGFFGARLRGLPLAKCKALAIEVGMQNSGLGAKLAVGGFSDPLVAVPSAIFSVWHNISGAFLANWFATWSEDSFRGQGLEKAVSEDRG
ncbi:MAG: bile acid:sodium symporter family protein [Candidatus Accumulibacter sp.]|jgi:BASS family bile acid:Na+ symporter|nr:bile acid:sodium symporter family protein [Accumulibacter sp.]